MHPVVCLPVFLVRGLFFLEALRESLGGLLSKTVLYPGLGIALVPTEMVVLA